MPNPRFYPSIGSLVKVDNLPDQLGFVKDGISGLLNNLYYRDLQTSKSTRGDSAFYSLSIVSLQRIDIEIGGTGIVLVLNPNHSGETAFPITVSYEWPVLAYVRGLNLGSFSFKGADIYDLALKVIGVSEKELIDRVLALFITDPTPINAFVDDVNSYYALIIQGYTPIPYPTSGDPVAEVINAIKNHQDLAAINQNNPSLVIFSVFLLNALSDEGTIEKINDFFSSFLHVPTEDYIKRLITPKIEATLGLGVGIEFPRNILVPLLLNGDPDPDVTHKSLLRFTTVNPSFTFSTERGIGYDTSLTTSLDASQIGNTGFTIDIQNAKLDISRETNIPEADADGRPKDFVGVFVESVDIGLPKSFGASNGPPPANPTTIKGRNLILGTGGISGIVGLDDPSGVITASLGGFEVTLDSFFLRFHQNEIVESSIKGTITIPSFEAEGGGPAVIGIEVHIGTGGDFEVTATTNLIPTIVIPDILKLKINSVEVGKKSGRFFVGIGGLLDFIADIPVLGPNLPKSLDIKKIVIWEDGQIELEGGTIVLPKAVTLKLGPVNLAVTAIGMGSHEQVHTDKAAPHVTELRKYRYVEFSAGLSVNPGGVDVRGDGVKLYFTIDNNGGTRTLDIFIRIAGIGIDLIIPGSASKETAAVLISGFISMREPTPSQSDPDKPVAGSTADIEYAGGVDFILPKAKIAGSAAMRFNPQLPAFLIDIGLEISKPIPLGSTGLGIYGFRGLVGQRYVASKTYPPVGLAEDAEWYQYYKKKVPLADGGQNMEGIEVGKFEPKQGFSLGAGVSLATASDSGYSFSSKLFFLLSLPDVFLLQGQAAIQRTRIGLSDDDPPFFALIAITNKSVEAAFGANYKLPDTGTPAEIGAIAKIDGIIEMAFFFGNSSAWYVNVGRDTPAEKRVQARIFSLFNAYFYLMLNSGGIRAGAGASWALEKNFGPVGVSLGAYIDVAGRISFKPKQIGGSIQLGGYAKIKVFKFKFGFTVAASLAAEAPRPFIVTGTLTISIDLPKPFKDIDVNVSLTWVFDPQLNGDPVELLDVDPNTIQFQQPVRAVNLLTKETYKLLFQLGSIASNGPAVKSALEASLDFAIPMDSMIDIEFPKAVDPYFGNPPVQLQPGVSFGGNTQAFSNQELIGPQQGKSPMVDHRFKVSSVKIFSWDPATAAWVNYNLFTAATPLQNAPFINNSILPTLKSGFWQFDQPQKYTKLSILAQSPLSFLTSGAGGLVPEEFGTFAGTIFCPPVPIAKTCVNFDDLEYDVIGAGILRFLKNKVLVRVIGEDGQIIVLSNPPFGHAHALQLKAGSKLEIFFQEGVSSLDLKLTTKGDSITVEYFKREQQVDINDDPILDESSMTTYDYEMVGSPNVILQENLVNPVSYPVNPNDPVNPINKIVITANGCAVAQNIVCETLKQYAYVANSGSGNVSVIDVATNSVINTIAVGGNPAGVAINPAGTKVYVTNGNQVNVINTQTNLVIANITIGAVTSPRGVAVTSDNSFVYVVSNSEKKVYIIDAATNTLLPTSISVGDQPQGIVASTNNRVYVTNSGDDTVSVIDTITNTVTATVSIPVGSFPVGIDVTPDNAYVYTANSGLGTGGSRISKIDTVTFAVTTITLGVGSTNPLMPVVTPDGAFVYVTNTQNPEGNSVSVVKVSDNSIVATIPFPDTGSPFFNNGSPVGISITPDGKYVYTTNPRIAPNQSAVSVIDTDTNTIVSLWSPVVGDNPISIGKFIGNVPISLTPVAHLLQTFLNTLAANDDLTSPGVSFAGNAQYQNSFCGTALYTGTASGCGVVYSASFSTSLLDATITDFQGFDAHFRLEVENPGSDFVFTSVASFSNIMHDAAHVEEGNHYDFRITATLNLVGGGTKDFMLKGSSNMWPIVVCKVINYLLQEDGAYLLQENTGRIILDEDESLACSVLVHEMCWLNLKDHLINLSAPSFNNVLQDNQAMLNGLGESLLPVWRPETLFAVEISTQDTIVAPLSVQNASTGGIQKSFIFGFKTRGTIGHYHVDVDPGSGLDTFLPAYNDLLEKDREEQFKLASLKHYIDYGKSYPNADGNILSAKPLFFKNPKLLLFYLRDYVYSMLNSWDEYPSISSANGINIQMECVIKDPIEPPATVVTPLVATFEENDIPHISEEVTLLNNMLANSIPCTPVSGPITPIGVNTAFQMPDNYLLPLKLYTAIFNVRQKKYSQANYTRQNIREVHRYNFQTSRYESFQKQIESYILDDTDFQNIKKAIFSLSIIPFDLPSAQLIVNDTLPSNDALFTSFADRFDRLVDGALRIGALQAAVTTEFNIVRDANTQNVLGILIRNPEPFNDPKLPPTELGQSLTSSIHGGKVIFSKDRSMAFITNNSVSVALSTVTFTFNYFEYNVSAYAIKETQTVQITLI